MWFLLATANATEFVFSVCAESADTEVDQETLQGMVQAGTDAWTLPATCGDVAFEADCETPDILITTDEGAPRFTVDGERVVVLLPMESLEWPEVRECVDDFMQMHINHALGHAIGLGHTCDEGELCTDPAALTSAMYWTHPICDLYWPNSADQELLEETLCDTASAHDTGRDWSGPADVDEVPKLERAPEAGCGAAASAAFPPLLLWRRKRALQQGMQNPQPPR